MPSQWRANPLSTLSQSWSTSHTSKPHIRGMALDWHYIGNKSPNSRLVASLVGEQSSRQTDVIPLQANLSLQHKFSNWPIRSNPVSMCQCVTIRPIQKQFTNPLLKHHTACLSGKVDPPLYCKWNSIGLALATGMPILVIQTPIPRHY